MNDDIRKTWLYDAVVYEVYPQSYYDANGDGVGDLKGILEKLDYIRDCGFTAIWLNPINASSFRDAGYDVTDFYRVDPRYGTNEDYRLLCRKAHELGLRVVFDLVAGHTSIDHPWFVESSKAHPTKYRNRYIWIDGAFDAQEGIAGVGERDGAYIQNFYWSQPALNYGYAHPDPAKPWQLPVSHPDCLAMKEELKRIIAFWMDLGTDGFRVDMAASLIKGDTDGSAMRDFWQEIRESMEKRNPQCLMIAEWGCPSEAIRAGFHCDFLLHSGPVAYTSLFRYEKGRNTTSGRIGHSFFNREGKGNINDYLDRYLYDYRETFGKGLIGMITGNHDMQRLAYRRTAEEVRAAWVFLFTMPGVPFVYYGDEIGMDFLEGLPSKEGGYIRTGSRTPMQWDHGKNHGFSDSDTPYLPTDGREGAPTVEDQEGDETSLLSFVKELIAFRKAHPALKPCAGFEILHAGYPFVFQRWEGERKLFIAINPSRYCFRWELPAGCTPRIQQNVTIQGLQVVLDGVSFLAAEVGQD